MNQEMIDKIVADYRIPELQLLPADMKHPDDLKIVLHDAAH